MMSKAKTYFHVAKKIKKLIFLIPLLFANFRIVAQENILMFVSFDDTYYSEYVIMHQALTTAGYNVDVRSSALGQASVYTQSGEIPNNSTNSLDVEVTTSYTQFTNQFENLFGGPWDPSLNTLPVDEMIPIDGRIQDVPNMDNYEALVIVGGTGAVGYRYDGTYQDQFGENGRMVPQSEVEATAQQLNFLAINALLEGKPVLAQCHGASLAAYFRIPDSPNPGVDGLGPSILEGQYATGFPLNDEIDGVVEQTPVTLDNLGVNHRPFERVVISDPSDSWEGGQAARGKIITTRDWWSQTIAHAAKSLTNIIETYPDETSLTEEVEVLIIHGGPVNPESCAFGILSNDVPCNYLGELPADYTHLQALLEANSPNDEFNFNTHELNISGTTPPEYIADDQAAIESYLSLYDVVVFFKHYSTDVTDELEWALVNYADEGGTVLGIHHGMYNQSIDLDPLPAIEKEIISEHLFGAMAPLNGWNDEGWDSRYDEFDIVNSGYGHFISTYGVDYFQSDAILYDDWSVHDELPSNANFSHSYYPTFPIREEMYYTYDLFPGQVFGDGVNEVNTIFAGTTNVSGSEGETQITQARIAGFSKRFDYSDDGSEGKVICLVYGENIESYDVNHPYGQTIRNSVAWSRQGVEPSPPPIYNATLNPTNLQVIGETETTFNLTWIAPVVAPEVSITYSLSINGMMEVENLTETNYSFSGLIEGSDYSIVLQAHSSESENSEPVLLNVTTANVPPSVPTNLVLDDVGVTTASISWDASIDQASMPITYQVRDESSVLVSDIDGTSVTLAGLLPSSEYTLTLIALDAVGNESGVSEPLIFSTNEYENPEAIAHLSDEFSSADGLNGWTRLFQTEGWSEDPFNLIDVENDGLSITPSTSTWWNNYIGGMLYKEVTGDFIVTSYLNVEGTGANPFPVSDYSLAGLMLRVPQVEGYNAAVDFVDGQQNYYDAILGNTTSSGTTPSILRNNTVDGSSSSLITTVSSWELELRIARVGNQVVTMFREPSENWVVIEVFTRDLPATLQVGMVAVSDYGTASSFPSQTHNNTNLEGNHDLTTTVDFVRFRRPIGTTGLEGTLHLLSDSDLISILGEDIPSFDATLPSQPVSLLSSDVTESSFTLSWGPSTDPEGTPVTYNVYLDGNEYESGISDTSIVVEGLLAGTTYELSVEAFDEAGNSSPLSDVLEVETLNEEIPIEGDPLLALSDEFDEASSIHDFQRLNEVENWQNDPLIDYQIQSGQMIMEPSASTWWDDGVGAFSFKEITGNFAVTTYVHVDFLNGGVPFAWFSMAGLMVRNPQDENYDAQVDFDFQQQNYYNAMMGYTYINNQPRILYNNTTSLQGSDNPTVDVDNYEVELRIVRLGETLVTLYREPGGSWTLIDDHTLNRPDFGPTLQVGLISTSDWQTVSNNDQAFFFNNTFQDGNSDIVASFDYLRFSTPVIPDEFEGLDPSALSPADLLSFLSFNDDNYQAAFASSISNIEESNELVLGRESNSTSKNGDAIEIYPNPGFDIISVRIQSSIDKLVILDIYGREVLNLKDVSGYVELDVSEWKRGMYLIKTQNEIRKLILK